MRFRKRNKVRPELTLPTSGDVAMLLLIFFVVCSRIGAGKPVVAMSPPRSSTADAVQGGYTPVTISVLPDATVFLEGRPVDAESLRNELEGLLSQRQDRESRTVFIEVDRKTRWRAALVAIDAVNRAKGYVELKVIR
jgi:biopolymer transport protein ExbD